MQKNGVKSKFGVEKRLDLWGFKGYLVFNFTVLPNYIGVSFANINYNY